MYWIKYHSPPLNKHSRIHLLKSFFGVWGLRQGSSSIVVSSPDWLQFLRARITRLAITHSSWSLHTQGNWKVLGLEWKFHDGINFPLRRVTKELPFSFSFSLCHVRRQQEGGQEEDPQQKMKWVVAWPPELWETKFVLSKPSAYDFCYGSPTWLHKYRQTLFT
jgi:hypothetical protein